MDDDQPLFMMASADNGFALDLGDHNNDNNPMYSTNDHPLPLPPLWDYTATASIDEVYAKRRERHQQRLLQQQQQQQNQNNNGGDGRPSQNGTNHHYDANLNNNSHTSSQGAPTNNNNNNNNNNPFAGQRYTYSPIAQFGHGAGLGRIAGGAAAVSMYALGDQPSGFGRTSLMGDSINNLGSVFGEGESWGRRSLATPGESELERLMRSVEDWNRIDFSGFNIVKQIGAGRFGVVFVAKRAVGAPRVTKRIVSEEVAAMGAAAATAAASHTNPTTMAAARNEGGGLVERFLHGSGGAACGGYDNSNNTGGGGVGIMYPSREGSLAFDDVAQPQQQQQRAQTPPQRLHDEGTPRRTSENLSRASCASNNNNANANSNPISEQLSQVALPTTVAVKIVECTNNIGDTMREWAVCKRRAEFLRKSLEDLVRNVSSSAEMAQTFFSQSDVATKINTLMQLDATSLHQQQQPAPEGAPSSSFSDFHHRATNNSNNNNGLVSTRNEDARTPQPSVPPSRHDVESTTATTTRAARRDSVSAHGETGDGHAAVVLEVLPVDGALSQENNNNNNNNNGALQTPPPASAAAISRRGSDSSNPASLTSAMIASLGHLLCLDRDGSRTPGSAARLWRRPVVMSSGENDCKCNNSNNNMNNNLLIADMVCAQLRWSSGDFFLVDVCGATVGPWMQEKKVAASSLMAPAESDVVPQANNDGGNVLTEREACPHISPRSFGIVMEKLSGSVASLLPKLAARHEDSSSSSRRLSVKLVASIAATMGAALKFLHERLHYLHADIKLDNILYNSTSGVLRLCDFGCSLPLEELTSVVAVHNTNSSASGASAAASSSGNRNCSNNNDNPSNKIFVLSDNGAAANDTFAGSLVSMSPERLGCTQMRVGAAADVWALGIALAQLIIGEHPVNLLGSINFDDESPNTTPSSATYNKNNNNNKINSTNNTFSLGGTKIAPSPASSAASSSLGGGGGMNSSGSAGGAGSGGGAGVVALGSVGSQSSMLSGASTLSLHRSAAVLLPSAAVPATPGGEGGECTAGGAGLTGSRLSSGRACDPLSMSNSDRKNEPLIDDAFGTFVPATPNTAAEIQAPHQQPQQQHRNQQRGSGSGGCSSSSNNNNDNNVVLLDDDCSHTMTTEQRYWLMRERLAKMYTVVVSDPSVEYVPTARGSLYKQQRRRGWKYEGESPRSNSGHASKFASFSYSSIPNLNNTIANSNTDTSPSSSSAPPSEHSPTALVHLNCMQVLLRRLSPHYGGTVEALRDRKLLRFLQHCLDSDPNMRLHEVGMDPFVTEQLLGPSFVRRESSGDDLAAAAEAAAASSSKAARAGGMVLHATQSNMGPPVPSTTPTAAPSLTTSGTYEQQPCAESDLAQHNRLLLAAAESARSVFQELK